MKILQIISTPPFAWATGGSARVTYDLSRALALRGHEVTILTTDLYTPKQRYSITKRAESIEGIRIQRFRIFSNFLAWRFKIYIAPGLMKSIPANVSNFDVIHLQDLLSLQAIVTSYYCRKCNVPYVITPHGSIPWLTKKKLINRIFHKILGKKILFGAARIIVLNRTEFDQCLAIGIPENNIHIIPNGINLQDVPSELLKGGFRKKLELHNNEKIILYLGRLHESKGIDLLIKAFSILSREMEHTILLLIGPDDGYQNKLEELVNECNIQDTTIFLGYINDAEKILALIDSEMLVIPKFTGFPVTFLEASICGLPIITTPAGDMLDWIDNQVGLLVGYNEIDIKNAMKCLLADNNLKKKFSQNGIQLVKDKFGWDIIVKRIEETYQQSILADLSEKQ